jgi:hypothetical protein
VRKSTLTRCVIIRTMFGLNFRQIFYLLVVVALIYAGIQYVPPYLDSYQFNDFIRQEVKYAISARRTPDQVSASVLQKAKDMNIPLTARDIHITRRGPSFTLDVQYHFPIDMRVYQQDLVFRASETGETFE